jgi:hypothetical protein
MIISRCCKKNVYVMNDYFVCDKCGIPCHTVFSLQLPEKEDKVFSLQFSKDNENEQSKHVGIDI